MADIGSSKEELLATAEAFKEYATDLAVDEQNFVYKTLHATSGIGEALKLTLQRTEGLPQQFIAAIDANANRGTCLPEDTIDDRIEISERYTSLESKVEQIILGLSSLALVADEIEKEIGSLGARVQDVQDSYYTRADELEQQAQKL